VHKHAFPSKKYFTPTLGGNTKKILVGIITLSSLKKVFLDISWLQKGGMWLCKIKVLKKRERKKRTSVLERKRIKDSPYHPMQRPLVLQRKKDILKRAM
jgi:hypothetical protein